MRAVVLALLAAASPLATAASFGEPVPADATPVAIAVALRDPAALGEGPRAFSGRIGQVCQNKACWMTLTEGDAMVRVMTKHRYFLPKDAKGDAVVYGTLQRKELDAEQTAHMAEEGGLPAPAEGSTSVEWRIDAAGVTID
jgi:hypothetical protein